MSDNYRERETTLVHRQFRHELIQNQDSQITKRAEGNNQDKSSDVVDSSSSSSPASGLGCLVDRHCVSPSRRLQIVVRNSGSLSGSIGGSLRLNTEKRPTIPDALPIGHLLFSYR